MNLSRDVKDILHLEGVDEPVLLGSGEDALAFALSGSEVIRVFPEAPPNFVSELADLYACVREHTFSFQCPRIYDVRTHNGFAYTIEARLPGRPMREVCRNLEGSARHRILRNYLSAIRELATIEMDDFDFGGLIPSTVWRTGETWEGFLALQLQSSLTRPGSQLADYFPDLSQTVSRLKPMFNGPMSWDKKSLVHGDAFPGNVLVTDGGEVATILDFGRHSLAGDPRLDIAIAIELTEFEQGFTPKDTFALRELIDDDPVTVNAYRAYTAILLAAEYSGDGRIVQKCLESLRETSGKF